MNIHWNDSIKEWCDYVPNTMSVKVPIAYTIILSLVAIVTFQCPGEIGPARWGLCLFPFLSIFPWLGWLSPDIEVETTPPLEDGGGI